MQGLVKVNEEVITKPGHQVAHDAVIELALEEPKYVSRAGFKLEAALDYFNLDVTGMVALDAGISTGGFTDCALQHGASEQEIEQAVLRARSSSAGDRRWFNFPLLANAAVRSPWSFAVN